MRSLFLLNGSPRGERSNTMKMLARVGKGWEHGGGNTPETLHLARSAGFQRAVEAFSQADVVLLAMPLHTDSMPALVKTYIEALVPQAASHGVGNTTLAFLVQSGFPEALHSRPLERYLEKLARRLGSPYAGTIVRGGGESLQMMPDEANKKLWARLRTLGEAVAGTERFSAFAAALASAVVKLPIVQFYWNSQLKKNGAWERRFDAPYGPAFRS
jgi:hypothetical protein